MEGRYVAQINERAQDNLRKELTAIAKESVPEWKEVSNENILAKAYVKYKKNEKTVIGGLVTNPEEIPIFDVENI